MMMRTRGLVEEIGKVQMAIEELEEEEAAAARQLSLSRTRLELLVCTLKKEALREAKQPMPNFMPNFDPLKDDDA